MGDLIDDRHIAFKASLTREDLVMLLLRLVCGSWDKLETHMREALVDDAVSARGKRCLRRDLGIIAKLRDYEQRFDIDLAKVAG